MTFRGEKWGGGVDVRGMTTVRARLTKFRFVKINGKRSRSNVFGRCHLGICFRDFCVLLTDEIDIYLDVYGYTFQNNSIVAFNSYWLRFSHSSCTVDSIIKKKMIQIILLSCLDIKLDWRHKKIKNQSNGIFGKLFFLLQCHTEKTQKTKQVYVSKT